MPRVSDQLLLFTYVSPFCLFKIASSPLTYRSPRISRISGAGAGGGRQSSTSSAAFLPPPSPLTCERELFLPQGLERTH